MICAHCGQTLKREPGRGGLLVDTRTGDWWCRANPSNGGDAAPHEEGGRPGVTFTRDQVEAWVGHVLTDDEVTDLEEAAPNSSIPEAFESIAHEGLGIAHRTGEDARS